MTITIKAVGDIAPGDCSVNGYGLGTAIKKNGLDFLFSQLNGVIEGADILIGTLEGSLSKRSKNEHLRLCGIPEFAEKLANIGFDVISVANNHSFDHGPEVFLETVQYCRDAGLQVCGLKGKDGYHCQPVMIEKNSMKIGLLAYNWIGLDVDQADEIGKHIAIVKDGIVNYSWNRDENENLKKQGLIAQKNQNVRNDIKKLSNYTDIIILIPHWGYEWTFYPPYGLTLEARSMIDAGADIIFGSHSHAPQGVEEYKNGIIAYSLGNFLWDSIADMFRFGIVLKYTISNEKNHTYSIQYVKRTNKFQPAFIKNNEDDYNKIIKNSSEIIISSKAKTELNDEFIYNECIRQYKRLKLRTLCFYLQNIIFKPYLVKSFIRKIFNFIEILFLRLKGKRIKW